MSSRSFAPPDAAREPTTPPTAGTTPPAGLRATGAAAGRGAEHAAALGVAACRVATRPEELEAHLSVRRRVFCDEQRLFDRDDRDGRDEAPGTLHVVGVLDGRVEGAVRLYPLDEHGLWKGDRLAVLPDRRVHRMGAMLVRFAVRTAGELGGRRMIAHIQLANVRFFESLGWRRDGEPAPYQGIEHQLMTTRLAGVSRSRRDR